MFWQLASEIKTGLLRYPFFNYTTSKRDILGVLMETNICLHTITISGSKCFKQQVDACLCYLLRDDYFCCKGGEKNGVPIQLVVDYSKEQVLLQSSFLSILTRKKSIRNYLYVYLKITKNIFPQYFFIKVFVELLQLVCYFQIKQTHHIFCVLLSK